MFSSSRIAFTAIILAASVAVAQAQPEEQDHTAHHPGGQTAQPTATPQGQAGGTSMMGGDMGQMMQTMRRMHGMMSGGAMGAMGPGSMRPFAHIEGQIAYYEPN